MLGFIMGAKNGLDWDLFTQSTEGSKVTELRLEEMLGGRLWRLTSRYSAAA